MDPVTPAPGTVVRVDGACSPQFGGGRALTVRVVSVDTRPTYPGWLWLTGYVLGPTGDAVDKRDLYVLEAGLRTVQPPRITVRAPARSTRTHARA